MLQSLNKIIILCSYKPRIEVLNIEGNKKKYSSRCYDFARRYLYCCSSKSFKSVATLKISANILEAALNCVKWTHSNLEFATASKNIFRHRKYENYSTKVAEEMRKKILEAHKKERREELELSSRPMQINVSVNPNITVNQNSNTIENG